MPARRRTIEIVATPAIGSSDKAQATLRDIVKDALLKILNDDTANAAAKASASRTLLEHFDDRDSARATRRGVDMTASELDAAIDSLSDRNRA